ncbi:MAG: hypothetical protein WB988_26295 [Candidatus Nitrosopolaris sp.]|jgi:hypothetical protein
MASRHLSRIENMIHLYIYIVSLVLAIPAETVAVAYFLRYFEDQIGRATFWTNVRNIKYVLVLAITARMGSYWMLLIH